MNNKNNLSVKSGSAALVGAPNVGKSTLLNSLLGQKISIVSPKPQTTRNRILGIVNGADHQILFLDTPGIHKTDNLLNQEMVKIALDTLTEVDAIIFMIDAAAPLPQPEKSPIKYLKTSQKPAILVINKIDLINKENLLPIINCYQQLYNFTAIIPTAALHNDGTDVLLKELLKILPEGVRLYPEDIPTDASERFIVAEIIREKIFLLTGQEIPYATAVTVESFKENQNKKLTTIHATIYVEKKSQKGIIIGKKGVKLQQIGTAARHDIKTLLAQNIMLNLWVKVRQNWSKDQRFLTEELGF